MSDKSEVFALAIILKHCPELDGTKNDSEFLKGIASKLNSYGERIASLSETVDRRDAKIEELRTELKQRRGRLIDR